MASREELVNDSSTFLRVALDHRQAQTWTSLPAIVTKVNSAAWTIECQPAIMGVIQNPDGSEQIVNLPVLVDVPICFPRAGGFVLSLPIAVGDEVLVVFSSRCIDSWWQSGGIQAPAERRMHDLSDGFAIPGPVSQPKATVPLDTTNAVLSNTAGTMAIKLTPAGITILGNVAVTGTLTAQAISGTGNMMVTGSITATGDVVGQGKSLHNHTHSGVQTGSGTSGPPT